jgi:hypothetical protein
MKFAKLTYRIAGIWGLLILIPMYFMYDFIGRKDPPPLTHPQFYFGFLGVTLAWQILFLILGTDPARYRPMMIPSIVEKLSFIMAMFILLLCGLVKVSQAVTALPDVILVVLFFIAFAKTKTAAEMPLTIER